MPKEWILNSIFNRFQLGYQKNVGPLAEEIRKCKPKTLEDWENYYYNNVRTKEHLIKLGQKLWEKISTVAKQEIESITLDDCINYVIDVVIRRTFEGFQREMSVIKGILEKETGMKFHPSTSELERLGVDYYAIVNGHLIGIQIKPLTYGQSRLVESFKKFVVEEPHKRFQNLYGGRVYLVIALGRKEKVEIVDRDKILKSIKQECERLKKLPPGRFIRPFL
ncbi:MAG: MjaI family restriction endonuclease [Nitrososphaerota archaeon]